MKITFKASNLLEALSFVGTVEPRALTAQQHSAAYLFNCKMADGKPYCHVFSRSDNQVARAGFELEELEGEGLFTLPSKHADLIREIPDDTVTMESKTEDKSDGEAYMLSIRSTSGTKYDHSTFNPRLVTPCDKEFDAAVKNGSVTYNVGILREALSMASPFLPGADKKGDIGEHFNTIQIFDQSNPECAKGDGHLFCSDAARAFFFEAEEFKNKGFSIHQKHVGKLTEFLGKCDGVRIYRGTSQSFAVNVKTEKVKDAEGKETGEVREIESDQLFAWNHDTKAHTRFAYYSLARDKYVIIAPKSTLLKALNQAKILIDQKMDKVKLVYTHQNTAFGGGHSLHFGSNESAGKVESFFVPTDDSKREDDRTTDEKDFECFVNLDHFKSIIDRAIGNQVELRISPIVKDDVRRGGAMIRTIDDVPFDANGKVASGETPVRFKCKVTRFMPSML